MEITRKEILAAWSTTINLQPDYEGRHRRNPMELSPRLKRYLHDTEGLRYERRDRSRDRLPS